MANQDGLPLGYRIGWRIRRVLLTLFGPAQLGDDDPVARLEAERAARIAQARAGRPQDGDGGGPRPQRPFG